MLSVALPSFGSDAVPAPVQQTDPEAPSLPPVSQLPFAEKPRTNEGALIVGEFALSTLTLSAIGVASYYAMTYQPPSLDMAIPRTTAVSNAVNLGGLAALLAAPFLAAKLVCSVGGSSPDFDGNCGLSVGLAYGGGGLGVLVAFAATTHLRPGTCNDGCGITGPSPVATLIAYVAGATLGAVAGWNFSKRRKDGFVAWLQPIYRAGPERPMLSARFESTPGTIQVPVVAFAF